MYDICTAYRHFGALVSMMNTFTFFLLAYTFCIPLVLPMYDVPYTVGTFVFGVLVLRTGIQCSLLQIHSSSAFTISIHFVYNVQQSLKWVLQQFVSCVGLLWCSYQTIPNDHSLCFLAMFIMIQFAGALLMNILMHKCNVVTPYVNKFKCDDHSTECSQCFCSVCLESKHGTSVMYGSKCSHSLHVECFLKVVHRTNSLSCIECRQPFVTQVCYTCYTWYIFSHTFRIAHKGAHSKSIVTLLATTVQYSE
jgi:hypothetical protein